MKASILSMFNPGVGMLRQYSITNVPLLRARVDGVKGQVDLSLRLSQVDPEAAKKQRRNLGSRKEKVKKKKKEVKALKSDGESCEADTE